MLTSFTLWYFITRRCENDGEICEVDETQPNPFTSENHSFTHRKELYCKRLLILTPSATRGGWVLLSPLPDYGFSYLDWIGCLSEVQTAYMWYIWHSKPGFLISHVFHLKSFGRVFPISSLKIPFYCHTLCIFCRKLQVYSLCTFF